MLKKISGIPEVKIIAICLFFFAFLQVLRPCYFLTDDNLVGWLPVIVEMGRRIFEFKDPFFNEYLYGGTDLRLDAGCLTFFNPVTLLVSGLSVTRFYYWMADATALFHLCAGAIFFYRMSRALQLAESLILTDKCSMFLALSWSFNAYVLSIGSSWINFLGNMAAMPLLFWGIFQTRPRTSFLLLFSGTLYSLFCGHLHPFLYTAAIFTLLVMAVSWQERRWRLLGRWILVHLIAVLMASPILAPGLLNVMGSGRVQIDTITDSAGMNLPALVTAASLMVGPFSLLGIFPVGLFLLAPAWVASLGFSAASLCFAGALYQGIREKGKMWAVVGGITLFFLVWKPSVTVLVLVPFLTFLLWATWNIFSTPRESKYAEISLSLILFLLLLIQRPEFLSKILAFVPVYRLLQWPCRETLQLVFFMHIFLCFKMGGFSRRLCYHLGISGICILSALLILGVGGGSLNSMDADRKLVISGQAESWWEKNQNIDGGQKWLPVMEKTDLYDLYVDIPYSLLGAYNYPSLFRVKSEVGYWGSWMPLGSKLGGVTPHHWSGVITQEDADRLRQQGEFQYVRIRPLENGWIRVEASGAKGVNSLILKPTDLTK